MKTLHIPSATAIGKTKEKTQQVIGRYIVRWGGTVPPIVLCALMTVGTAWVPLDDPDPFRFKAILIACIAAFAAGWTYFVAVVPTMRYRRYKRDGYIIEITDPNILAYYKSWYAQMAVLVASLRVTEGERFATNLHAMHELAERENRDGLRTLISHEQQRLVKAAVTLTA